MYTIPHDLKLYVEDISMGQLLHELLATLDAYMAFCISDHCWYNS